MIKRRLVLIAALVTGTAVYAAEPLPSYSVTADLTYASDYVFRGVKYAGSSLQPSVELGLDNFNVGVWTNQPLTSNTDDEVDVYGSYRVPLNTRMAVEVLGTYYWFPEATRSLGETRRTYELGVGTTYEAGPFTPSVYYFHDFRLDADTIQAAIGHRMALGGSDIATIETSIFGGVVDIGDVAPDAPGATVKDGYNYYGIDLSVPFRVAENATFTVAGHYVNTDNLAGVTKDHHTWVTVGMTIGF